jgi:hypothetical protein
MRRRSGGGSQDGRGPLWGHSCGCGGRLVKHRDLVLIKLPRDGSLRCLLIGR